MNHDSDGYDMFVNHYFSHDGIQLNLSDLTPVCDLCDDR